MERARLAFALAVGKTFDATSTIFVFSARTDVVESIGFTRFLFETFGLVLGSILSIAVAVCGLALLAESGALLRRLAPEEWVPRWYPRVIRVGAYVLGACFFTALGVHNLSLLA